MLDMHTGRVKKYIFLICKVPKDMLLPVKPV